MKLRFKKSVELEKANRRLRVLYFIVAVIITVLFFGMLEYLVFKGIDKSVSDYHCRYERICEVR